MAQLQVPRSENAVDRSGTFKGYWSAWFAAIGKKFSATSSVAQVTSPDASDLATAITLANELKSKLNALTTALNS